MEIEKEVTVSINVDPNDVLEKMDLHDIIDYVKKRSNKTERTLLHLPLSPEEQKQFFLDLCHSRTARYIDNETAKSIINEMIDDVF